MITDRIDAVTKIAPRYMTALPPPPLSAKIEISPRCNFRCGYCALRQRDAQPKRDMDFDLFRRIAGELKQAGVEEIGVFHLGEPFMGPKLLVECIRHLKRELAIPYVFLTSNAALAFPDAVEACMQAGLDSLKWSINAADAQQFEQTAGVSGRMYNWALLNLRAAWELRQVQGHATRLYASSIRYDGAQQAAMAALLAERVLPYVDEHYWLPLYSAGAFAAEREAALGYRPSAGNQGRIGALREPLPCWTLFTEAHVTAAGKLSACCFDATDDWVMGDLTRQSFMQAWHAPAFAALRAAHLRRDVRGTACANCIAYR